MLVVATIASGLWISLGWWEGCGGWGVQTRETLGNDEALIRTVRIVRATKKGSIIVQSYLDQCVVESGRGENLGRVFTNVHITSISVLITTTEILLRES